MDEVRCTGSEDFLSDCPFNGWGNHDCSHYEDAGVICQGKLILILILILIDILILYFSIYSQLIQ